MQSVSCIKFYNDLFDILSSSTVTNARVFFINDINTDSSEAISAAKSLSRVLSYQVEPIYNTLVNVDSTLPLIEKFKATLESCTGSSKLMSAWIRAKFVWYHSNEIYKALLNIRSQEVVTEYTKSIMDSGACQPILDHLHASGSAIIIARAHGTCVADIIASIHKESQYSGSIHLFYISSPLTDFIYPVIHTHWDTFSFLSMFEYFKSSKLETSPSCKPLPLPIDVQHIPTCQGFDELALDTQSSDMVDGISKTVSSKPKGHKWMRSRDVFLRKR